MSHTTTTTQARRGGEDCGVRVNQKLGDRVTYGACSPVRASDAGIDLVASAIAGNITNHNADTTRNRHPLWPNNSRSNTNHDANATATPTAATVERTHPLNNSRG